MKKHRPTLAIGCLLLGVLLFAGIIGNSPRGTPEWPIYLAIFCLSAVAVVVGKHIIRFLAAFAWLLSGVAVVKCYSQTIQLWRMHIEVNEFYQSQSLKNSP